MQSQFSEIIALIKQARANSFKAVNTELINLYWQVGQYISVQVANASWGDKTVEELALYIQQEHPELKGFNRRGLYRMKQFYDTYASTQILNSILLTNSKSESPVIVPSLRTHTDTSIVSASGTQLKLSDIRRTILTKLSWTHHRTIFSRCKSGEEMAFYLKASVKEGYTARELDRQISAGLFERAMAGNQSSQLLKKAHPDIANTFKDRYIFEFLSLEALDRDLRKEKEKPSIGVLLCKDKDTEVVEYALSRNLSPALVAEYKTQLPGKELLQRKLHELFEAHNEEEL